uniref:Uncharacterized protein n=1 Tax=Eptatretus burgeri TaxID=7764 RepID=A0A8C4Q883_EPTBU
MRKSFNLNPWISSQHQRDPVLESLETGHCFSFFVYVGPFRHFLPKKSGFIHIEDLFRMVATFLDDFIKLVNNFFRCFYVRACRLTVHLLCLLGNGFHRNDVCCHEDLKAMALSIVPHTLIPKAPCRVQLSWIQRLLTWCDWEQKCTLLQFCSRTLPYSMNLPVVKACLGATELSGADGEETNCSEGLASEDDFEANSSSSGSETSDDWGQRSCSRNREATKRDRAVFLKQQEECKKKKEEQAQGIGETNEGVNIERGCDAWLEVWVMGDGVQGSWVGTDVVTGMVACTMRGMKSFSYVLAFEADGSAKDLQQKLYEEPIPTKIAAFKNHPLYVLPRHLLKFQAIYPLSAKPLGNYRGEPIYARECVHNLHSEATWLKQARVVRAGEVPCKMVKGHSNWAKKARANDTMAKDTPNLPLFGTWQTEEYHPPEAYGGKVPRNDFGNVYLFRPSMLPIGCRHLTLPGLQRVARKLDIDCAAAVTGFDIHSGFSHPVYVYRYHQIITLHSLHYHLPNSRRVSDRWHLLAKSLLIRKRLQKRYGGDKDPSKVLQSTSKNNTSLEQSPIRDRVRSWPQVRPGIQAAARGQGMQRRRDQKSEDANLFPFEKL